MRNLFWEIFFLLQVIPCTQKYLPIVRQVSPGVGPYYGGTEIIIQGMNFKPNDFPTNVQVLIGSNECKILPDFTNNFGITCITPPCTSAECLSTQNWLGSYQSPLTIIVHSNVSTLTGNSTFIYNGSTTSHIYKMPHTVTSSRNNYVLGSFYISSLPNMQISLGTSIAELISNNQTADGLSVVAFKPLFDAPARFINMSVIINDNTISGTSGLSRLFSVDGQSMNQYGYGDIYEYDSTLTGVVYSVSILPVISNISPNIGSLSGGSVLEITGSGFGLNQSAIIVYASGNPCNIISVNDAVITCRTTEAFIDSNKTSQIEEALIYQSHHENSPIIIANTTRGYGSTGAWIKMNYTCQVTVGHNDSKSSYIWNTISGLWRDTLTFDLIEWSQSFQTNCTNYIASKTQIGLYLVAPYSGNYSFVLTSNSTSSWTLYNESQGILTKTVNATDLSIQDYYLAINDNGKNSPVSLHLSRGQRYFLIIASMNEYLINTSKVCTVSLGFRVTPDRQSDGILTDIINPTYYEKTAGPLPAIPETTSQTFLQYHAQREIQVIQFKFFHQYGIQEITISNAINGTFSLIMRDNVQTPSILLNCTSQDIVNALQVGLAVLQEDNFFPLPVKYVVDILIKEPLFLQFTIMGVVEYPSSSTLYDVNINDLNAPPGEWVSKNVIRLQKHSDLPTGTFTINLGPGLVSEPISYAASAYNLQYTLNKLPNVNVRVASNAVSLPSPNFGLTWVITFIGPRGNLPQITLNTTKIIGPQLNTTILTIQNGSMNTYWFNPIPSWMVEVPFKLIETAEPPNIKTNPGGLLRNVEVYRLLTSGDVLKAGCDAGLSFLENVINPESYCSFSYSSNLTATISQTNITSSIFGSVVSVFGYGFMSGSGKPVVSIANISCNILTVSNSYIECEIGILPYGQYYIVVDIPGWGYAYHLSSNQPISVNTVIYSIDNIYGSFAGGQVIVITGNGLNINGKVTVGNSECQTISANPSNISCIVPKWSGCGKYNSTLTQCSLNIEGFSPSRIFWYSSELTPRVSNIIPHEISSAMSTTIVINGTRFLGFQNQIPSVDIGGQECTIISASSDSVTCKLLRSRSVSFNTTQTVSINVPGKGFAAQQDDSSSYNLPTVIRGFGVISINHHVGSIFGGTSLVITGIGFTEKNISMYSVRLVNTIDPDVFSLHDQLVMKNYLKIYSPSSSISCIIQSVLNDQITCIVSNSCNRVSDTVYTTVVTLNDIYSTCTYGFRSPSCMFTQSLTYTPLITNAKYIYSSAQGIHIMLLGSFYSLSTASSYSVYFGTILCTVTNYTASTIDLRIPSSTPAGTQYFQAISSSYGYSNNNISYTVPLNIFGVSSAVQEMSLAGGSTMTVFGSGFISSVNSNQCSQNNITLTLSNGMVLPVTSNLYFSCSSTTLTFIAPSLSAILDIQNLPSLSITGVLVALNSLTANQVMISPLYYSLSSTPIVRYNHNQGYAFTKVTYVLTLPNPNFQSTQITIGNTFCNSLSISYSGSTVTLVCTMPPLPAGYYNVYISVASIGYALDSNYNLPYYESLLNVVSQYDLVSSSLGGEILTISGSGFSSETSVTICGNFCSLTSSSYSSVKCIIPAYQSISFISDLDLANISTNNYVNVINGQYFGSNPISLDSVDNLNEESLTTWYEDLFSYCYIGIAIRMGFRAQPLNLRYFIPFAPTGISVGILQGSIDGGLSYSNLGTNPNESFGWNYIIVNEYYNIHEPWFTHLRYLNKNSTTRCALSFLEFVGIVGGENSTCTIDISYNINGYNNTTTIGNVTYLGLKMTPHVQSIYPTYVPNSGGTLVNIALSNLKYNTSLLSVTLYGSECQIQRANSVNILCITGPYSPSINIQPVVVQIEGFGFAIVDSGVEFSYTYKWSDISIWNNNEYPIDGDYIIITKNTNLILDIDTPVLDYLIIEGSLLINPAESVSLDSHKIVVYGGILHIDTSSTLHKSSATITLHLSNEDNILPYIGISSISITSEDAELGMSYLYPSLPTDSYGIIEVIGKEHLKSWTVLELSAFKGSYVITVSDSVDFAAGDILVITGSSILNVNQLTPNFQYEVVTVGVNYHNRTIMLTSPLEYNHISEIVEIQGKFIDLRCEVALLTREIIFKGISDDFISKYLSDVQRYGFSMRLLSHSVHHISNAEFTQCGQLSSFYSASCIQGIFVGDMTNSYFANSSIHDTYYHGLDIYNGDNSYIQGNVVLNTTGHGYSISYELDSCNTFLSNLAIFMRITSLGEYDDVTPAGFFSSSPANIWIQNIATHSQHSGIWINFVLSNEATVQAFPSSQGIFSQQILKLNANNGMRINPQYLRNPRDTSEPLDPSYRWTSSSASRVIIDHCTMYRNGKNGFFARSLGFVQLTNSFLIENGVSDYRISTYYIFLPQASPNIYNCLFVGYMNSSTVRTPKEGLSLPQSEYFNVRSITFMNYPLFGAMTVNNNVPLAMQKSNTPYSNTQYTMVTLSNLTFINTTRRTFWTSNSNSIYHDLDGSLAGLQNSMVTAYLGLNLIAGCENLNHLIYDNSIVCNSSVPIRKVELSNIITLSNHVEIISPFGSRTLPIDPAFGVAFPSVIGNVYSVIFDNIEIGFGLTCTFSTVYYLESSPTDESVTIDIPVDVSYKPYSFDISYGIQTYLSPTHYTKLVNMAQSYYLNNTLYFYLTNLDLKLPLPVTTTTLVIESKQCEFNNCYKPPQFNISDPLLWSKNASWQSGQVPSAGDVVYIDDNMWIVSDISTPPLGCLYVYGRLTFLNSSDANIVLSIQCLVIHGRVEILGDSNEPYPGIVNIILTGEIIPIYSRTYHYEEVRSIKVHGSLVAYGKPVASNSAKLSTTAHVGSNQIRLSGKVDWKVGDEISLTPTAYYTSNSTIWNDQNGSAIEIFTITFLDKQDNTTLITLSGSLANTYVCISGLNESFCAYVTHLTRSITFSSPDDSLNPDSPQYGSGVYLSVLDAGTDDSPLSQLPAGYIDLNGVAFENFGNASGTEGILFSYSLDYPTGNVISNSVFRNSFYTAIRCASAIDINITGNVFINIWKGAIYLDQGCQNPSVIKNIVIGTVNIPDVFDILNSEYAYIPLAAITFFTSSGQLKYNVVSGSVDNGFAISQSVFLPNFPDASKLCVVTYGEAEPIIPINFIDNAMVRDNEAFATLRGLFLVTYSSNEVSTGDCLVLSKFKLWRNGHAGMISVDTIANVLVVKSTLAENGISASFNFHSVSLKTYLGIAESVISGVLPYPDFENECADLPDSKWPIDYPSDVSILSGTKYERVGIMIPQYLNAAKTCTFSSLDCVQPHALLSQCSLPYEKKYGLPTPNQYSEMHVFGTAITGFCYNKFGKSKIAIGVNPSQTDKVPQLFMSSLRLSSSKNLTMEDVFGFNITVHKKITRTPILIVNDIDGSLINQIMKSDTYSDGGQLYYDSYNLLRPKSVCFELGSHGEGFSYCPTSSNFYQFKGIWYDEDPKIRPSMHIQQNFQNDSLTYISSAPVYDCCSAKPLFNRFQLFFVDGGVHYFNLATEMPFSWTISWYAPTWNNSALIYLDISDSNQYRVFVTSNSPGQDMVFVPQIKNRLPSLDDPAGTNRRIMNRGSLIITIRGGDILKYTIQRVPLLSLSVTTSVLQKASDAVTLQNVLASQLNLDSSMLDYSSATTLNNTRLTYHIRPNVSSTATYDQIAYLVTELKNISQHLSTLFDVGTVSLFWNQTIFNAIELIPVVPKPLNETYLIIVTQSDPNFNETQFREDLILYNSGIEQNLVVNTIYKPSATSHPILSDGNLSSSNVKIIITVSVLVFICIFGTLLLFFLGRFIKGRISNISLDPDVFELFDRFGVDEYTDLRQKIKSEVKILISYVYTNHLVWKSNFDLMSYLLQDLIQSCALFEPRDIIELNEYCYSISVELNIPLPRTQNIQLEEWVKIKYVKLIIRQFYYYQNRRSYLETETHNMILSLISHSKNLTKGQREILLSYAQSTFSAYRLQYSIRTRMTSFFSQKLFEEHASSDSHSTPLDGSFDEFKVNQNRESLCQDNGIVDLKNVFDRTRNVLSVAELFSGPTISFSENTFDLPPPIEISKNSNIIASEMSYAHFDQPGDLLSEDLTVQSAPEATTLSALFGLQPNRNKTLFSGRSVS